MAPSRTPSHFPLPPLLFFFLLLEIFPTPLSFAVADDTDIISAGRSLSGSHKLTSRGGKFALGFFRPPDGISSAQYLGIWYDKIPLFTQVWVANRETPITDPAASELKIAGDGNLVLLDQSKSIIWSTDADIKANSTVAVILDNGNLELRDESNSSLVFWQSFDHPTDTWLPGSMLRLDKRTNQSQNLRSWKNKADPAPGMFTFTLDAGGTPQLLLLWNMSKVYWTSGAWDGHIFSSIPEMNHLYSNSNIFNYTYVTGKDENYLKNTVTGESVITRDVMDSNLGQIRLTIWMESTRSWMLIWSFPRSTCSVYALCGPFSTCNDETTAFCSCLRGFRAKSQTDWDLGDRTGGCVRKTPLQCHQNRSIKSDEDGFFEMPNVKVPDDSHTLAVKAAGTSEGCAAACLKNCSCTGYSFNARGCLVWFDGFLNLQDQYNGSDASTFYLRLAAAELQSSKISKTKLATPAIAVIIVGALAACFLVVWIMVRMRRGWRMSHKARGVGSSLVPFTYGDLQHATRNFSEKVGGGGFGFVFKGYLSDDSPIAVKKLEDLRQVDKQFRAEVSTIGVIQHVNIVRLLGFCSEATKKMLVYEFMPNGSLDRVLFHDGSDSLDWTKRYQIAVGTARGLAYLHEKCRDCIIHCDVKPENILLDASFNPKVADFGLAKLVGRDFSRVLTTIRGTRGYLAPEWITGMPITAKADVYSYGMMLFEIVSGRRNSIQTGESSFNFFPQSAQGKVAGGDVQSLVDERLAGEADWEEVERAMKLAYWCIQDDESCRPTMGQVVQVLEGVLDVSMPPVPRSLQRF